MAKVIVVVVPARQVPDTNRLTDDDRERIRTRVREVLVMWRNNGPRNVAIDRDALMRIAYHSIGCSGYDLRLSEAEEIHGIVKDLHARDAAGYGWTDTPCEPSVSAYTTDDAGSRAYLRALNRWHEYKALMAR